MTLTTARNDPKTARRKAAVERKLATTPDIQIFEDQLRVWQGVQASDGIVTVFGPFNDLAIRWARLIQLNLAAGMPFNKAARLALNEADYDRVPEGALRMATAALGLGWVHGKKLERWFEQERGGPRDILHGLLAVHSVKDLLTLRQPIRA